MTEYARYTRSGPPWPAAVAERFWSKVDKRPGEGCWLYRPAVLAGDGEYGVFHPTPRESLRATRFVVELLGGVPLAPHMFVCHACDTTACVRYDVRGRPYSHLFVASQAVNDMDRVLKNRSRGNPDAAGESNPAAVLTADQVAAIRLDLERASALGPQLRRTLGLTHQAIAARHGVDRSTVTKIASGTRW